MWHQIHIPRYMLSAYLTLKFEKFFIVNMIHSDRGEAGGQLPPQILADQKAPPGSGVAARRIPTCPPSFLDFATCLVLITRSEVTEQGRKCWWAYLVGNCPPRFWQNSNAVAVASVPRAMLLAHQALGRF